MAYLQFKRRLGENVNFYKLDLLSNEEFFKLIDIYENDDVSDDYYISFVEEVLRARNMNPANDIYD